MSATDGPVPKGKGPGTPTAGTRRRRKPASETRGEIIHTAEALFRERGYGAVAIADIAAELGMSPANVFKHFHSKANLVDAITLRHIETAVERFAAIGTDGPAPVQLHHIVKTLMEAHLRDLQQNPYLFEMILLTANADLQCGNRYREMMVERFERVIEQGCRDGCYTVSDVPRAARSTFFALGSVLHPVMIAHEHPDKLATRCDEIVDLINAALQGGLAK